MEINLPLFLRQLADHIDNKNLTDEQIRSVSEFYMHYKFQSVKFDRTDDISKFLILGWYYYTLLRYDKIDF